MEQGELGYELITPSARIATATHGGRAKCLQRLLRLELPVPKTVAISFAGVHSIAAGNFGNLPEILNNFNNNDHVKLKLYNNFVSKVFVFGKSFHNALYFGNIPPFYTKSRNNYLYLHNPFYTMSFSFLFSKRPLN